MDEEVEGRGNDRYINGGSFIRVVINNDDVSLLRGALFPLLDLDVMSIDCIIPTRPQKRNDCMRRQRGGGMIDTSVRSTSFEFSS